MILYTIAVRFVNFVGGAAAQFDTIALMMIRRTANVDNVILLSPEQMCVMEQITS